MIVLVNWAKSNNVGARTFRVDSIILLKMLRSGDHEHSPASTLKYEPENDNEHHDSYAFA